MLKKRLGAECIESERCYQYRYYYKIPTTLIIPESVEWIGIKAFWCCRELKRVVIPGNVKSIGKWAFRGCNNLKEVVIPEGCKSIGDYAFYKCKELKKVIISKSVERIGDMAFGYCYNSEITLRKSKSEFGFIGIDAFYNVKDVKEEIRS